jgi:hypothetical protein
MRIFTWLALLAIVCLLSGCETPTKAYVKQHPELSPEHRKIILSGRIKFGDPVVGMTREQVRLVMGTDPDQFDSINGEDAWIWFKSKAAFARVESDADTGGSAREGGGGRHNESKTADQSTPSEGRPNKTTVFFKGDVATRVEFGGGTL